MLFRSDTTSGTNPSTLLQSRTENVSYLNSQAELDAEVLRGGRFPQIATVGYKSRKASPSQALENGGTPPPSNLLTNWSATKLDFSLSLSTLDKSLIQLGLSSISQNDRF